MGATWEQKSAPRGLQELKRLQAVSKSLLTHRHRCPHTNLTGSPQNPPRIITSKHSILSSSRRTPTSSVPRIFCTLTRRGGFRVANWDPPRRVHLQSGQGTLRRFRPKHLQGSRSRAARWVLRSKPLPLAGRTNRRMRRNRSGPVIYSVFWPSERKNPPKREFR